jgi:cellulose synthase/poly-beta-1,6-N-acetylglucosamine synthase-like glycosyltransferase
MLTELWFWVCAACLVYVYALYPLGLAVLARLRGRPVAREAGFTDSVSIILAAHNEEKLLDRRLTELTSGLAASGVRGELILVSDGSADATAAVARGHAPGVVRVLELPRNVGKAAALTAGCAAARHAILVFGDVRQSWAPDALNRLLENFADPTVGAVSGDLVVESTPGVLAGVGLYWRFEKWLRRRESRLYSLVGSTGAISAVRRELFRPIPPGTILDDMYWPLGVVRQGFRVVHDTRARAFDRLPGDVGAEFRRKVRTLTGNYQLVARQPGLLLPWRNPVCFQLVSHKLLRLAVPWALLGLLGTSAVLPGPWYRAAFGAQVAFYGLGLLGLLTRAGSRLRVAAAAGSFLVLNSAAWLAFWVWCSGRAARSWRRTPSRQRRLESCAHP